MSFPHFPPLVDTPFTGFITLLNPTNCQSNPKSLCARIERRFAGCLEAYGYGKRGKEKCQDLFYDFHECLSLSFQTLRYQAIRKERMRKYLKGELKKPFEDHAPIDGLIYYELV